MSNGRRTGFSCSRCSRDLVNLVNSEGRYKSRYSLPYGQKSINLIDYALRVAAADGIIYRIPQISRARRAGEWIYGFLSGEGWEVI